MRLLCVLLICVPALGACGGGGGDEGPAPLPDVVNFFDTGLPEDTGTGPDPDTMGQPETKVEVTPEIAALCEPGHIECLDDTTVKTCTADGMGWDHQVCEAGFACDLGYCAEIICEPGESEGICLTPDSFSQCSENGTKWEGAYCTVPAKCYQGGCAELECPPGDMLCMGLTAVQECMQNDEGVYKWTVSEECGAGHICEEAKCLSVCDVNLKDESYLGCDYWAVDLDNIEDGKVQQVAIVVSLPTTATVPTEVSIFYMGEFPPKQLTAAELGEDNMTIQPGALKKFLLPKGYDLEGSILTNKSFRVSSLAPVTVHQFNPLNGVGVFTNDASLLLPSNVGGLEYYVMSWKQRTIGNTFRGGATIVATQEGTTSVQVWPSSMVLPGPGLPVMLSGQGPYTIDMEQGDVVNIETDGNQGADLTGTRILADKKVNVFGNHECANIPEATINYCDHVEQQLFPVTSWGKTYIADGFKARNSNQKDRWRIMAAEDGTTVTLDPPSVAGPFNLNKGEWTEFDHGDSFAINGSKPIQVGHYMHGSNYDGFSATCGFGTGIGDPAFTLGIPTEQYLDEYIVLTPDLYQEDYLNIIFQVGSEMGVTIDGNSLLTYTGGSPPVPVGDTGWALAQVEVSDGTHTVKSETPVGVTAYGYDCDVSYAYPGGLSLKAIEGE